MSQTTDGANKTQESFTLRQLQHPTEAQIIRSAEIFANLMLKNDDIAVVALCGGNRKLLMPLALAMIRAGVLEGEFYAAIGEGDDILGYVMTMPKGRVLFSTDAQKELGLTDFMAQLSEEGKKYYTDVYLKTFPQFVASCIEPETMIDVWWIHMAFTREQSQRQGIASGLIRQVLDKAVSAGHTVALSTTSAMNVPIYQNLGFKLIGERSTASPWGDWSLWVFRYEPTKAGNAK